MATDGWNPWKMTAIGMALVIATALITGLVVASWKGGESPQRVEAPAPMASVASPTPPPPPPVARKAAGQPAAAPPSGMPTQATVDACNRYASSQVGPNDQTKEVVKDALIGAVAGAAIGAAGGAIADGGRGAGKGAAIGGLVGAGGGTLYGLNENSKNNARYRAAYGSCMRSRGYPG
jgi:hypothetical protein